MAWIQVVGNIVNLIGGSEVGLPLPDSYLSTHPNVLQFDQSLYPNVTLGMYYDTNAKEFVTQDEYFNRYPQPGQPDPTPLEEHITTGIGRSKEILDEVFKIPFVYNGKSYDVSRDHQESLTSQLTWYLTNINDNGTAPQLRWAALNEEAYDWTFNDLKALLNAIQTYVRPLYEEQHDIDGTLRRIIDPNDIDALLRNFRITLYSMIGVTPPTN